MLLLRFEITGICMLEDYVHARTVRKICGILIYFMLFHAFLCVTTGTVQLYQCLLSNTCTSLFLNQ